MLRGRRAGFLRYSNEPSRISPDLCKVGWASSALRSCVERPSGGLYGPRPGSSRQHPRTSEVAGRLLDEHRQTYWLLTESRTAPAHMSSELRPTHVSVLTGAGRLVQRAPPELRPKCDRVDFEAQNTLDSRANVKFSDIRAIHKFGRRPLDMWRRH